MKPNPTFTASAAAHAARLPVRAFSQIATFLPLIGASHRRAGQWRRADALNVVRFAVAGRAFSLGLSAQDAAAVVGATIDHHITGLAECGLELPASFLLGRLHDVTVAVFRDADGGFECRPAHLARTAEAAIVLRLGQIAADAIARLAASESASPCAGKAPSPEVNRQSTAAAGPSTNEESN